MGEGVERGDLGERVREAIKQSGRTQASIAQALGMSPPAFSRLLRHSRNLKLPQLQRIADLCGVGFETLVGVPSEERCEIWPVFRELVLLGMPAAVAYDLATGRGGLLKPAERERLDQITERLRAAFQAGQGPAGLRDLLALDSPTADTPADR